VTLTRAVSMVLLCVSPAIAADVVATNGSRQRTIFVDSVNGSDRRGCGKSAEHACQTIGSALDAIPSLVDGGYTIQLAAGVYREQVTLDRFVMPAGIPRTLVLYGIMPSRFILIRGQEADPEHYVIQGDIHCINATGVLLMVRGLTCQGASDSGLYATTSSILLDDVRFFDNRGGIHLENSLGHLGGTLRAVGNTGIVISLRNNTFVRDTTPWHAAVDAVIQGGSPHGIFLRDHSSLALQNADSQVAISDVVGNASSGAPCHPCLAEGRAVYAQQHAHVFGGTFTVANCDIGFQAVEQAYINVDVSAAAGVGLLASAIKESWVGLERPGSLTNVNTLVQAGFLSLAAVGDTSVFGEPCSSGCSSVTSTTSSTTTSTAP